MGLGDSTSLLFRIKGDASDAVRAFKQTEDAGKGLAGGMGALVNPATIAAAAITAIATSAASAGLALFNLAKSASDYGSEIFDATEKTGLAAETISSLKFAADQAGSSLDQVVGGLARFSKTIGEAAAGSEQAQAKLKTLGVTSTDLDTALGQALANIARYTPGVAQMTAAQAAFGKSGADLLTFIKSFDGNLPGLIAKCKELGLTIDGKTAKAADDFGDSLDTVTKQLGLVGKTIGIAVIPVFNKLFTDLSGWLQNNKSEVTVWAGVIADAFRGALIAGKNLVNGLLDAKDFFGAALSGEGYQGYVDRAAERRRMGESPDVGPSYLPGGRKDADPSTLGLPGGVANANKVQNIDQASNSGEFNRAARENAEKNRKELLDIQQKGIDDGLALDRAETEKKLAELEYRHSIQLATDKEYIEERQKLTIEALEYEIAVTKQLAENETLTANERMEINRRLAILDLELKTQRVKNSIEIKEANDEATESEREQLAAIQETTEAIDEMTGAIDRQTEAQDRKLERQRQENDSVLGGGGIGGAIGDSLGVDLVSIFDENDAIKEKADYMQDIFADLSEGIGQSIGAIVEGMGQMVTAWITGADFSAKAALKMAAGVAIGLAIQAGMKAIFEYAEGLAAAASFNYYSAGLHFAAAKMYGVVALVAGVAGVGLGLAARAVGGDSKSASKTVGSQTQKTERLDRNVDGQGKPYSGQKENSLVGALNAPIRLELKLNSHGVLDVVEDSAGNNGRMRDLILKVSGS